MKLRRFIIYLILVFLMTFFNFYLRPISGNKLVDDNYKKSDKYINSLYKSDEYFKTKLLNKDEYYIYDTIISASLNNQFSVSIDCEDDCSSAFIDSYYAIYLDHPELISFFGISSYKVDDRKISYNNYQNMGKIRSLLGVMRIEREIDLIKRDTKDLNDKEKIIYVYNYVASHNYDTLFTYIGSNQSAYSFFSKKSSVCAGFAKATQIIFQNIGIDSYLVLSSDHMWNYVKYDGKYYVFDATVGASYSDKSVDGYYDGLSLTGMDYSDVMFSNFYPKVEDYSLRKIFKL